MLMATGNGKHRFAPRYRFLAISVSVLLLGMLAMLTAGPLGADATVKDRPLVATLEIGDSKFWDGEYVEEFHGGKEGIAAYFFAPKDQQSELDPCAADSSVYCRLYLLKVNEPGGRLVVSLDSSKRSECFYIELRDPEGVRSGSLEGNCPDVIAPQKYTVEARTDDAATAGIESIRNGVWEIRVMGADLQDWAFRMRASLMDAPGKEPADLRPNLVPWPPWEFGFIAPASPAAGLAFDRQNPPGPAGISCHPDEHPATKCLRFSAGLYNVGDGPLYVGIKENDDAIQHVYYSDEPPHNTPGHYGDNPYYEWNKGAKAEFHSSHVHLHFDKMVLWELFEAVDINGGQTVGEKVAPGAKHGWCTVPQQIQNWFSFDQDPYWSQLCDSALLMPRGWGEPYRWQRPGQYVPYDAVADADGTMRAGLYVVRVTIDPDNLLLETQETDNVGYAYIRVIDGTSLTPSDRVVVCERGYGLSPWDPKKSTVDTDPFLWAKRLEDPKFTPERC